MIRQVCLVLAAVSAGVTLTAQPTIPPEWTQRAEPFRVMDNIHYVGTADLASYLITTPAGHVLLDTGLAGNAGAIVQNIRTLGFNVRDVRLLLTTHAHFDHVGAHARIKKLSGARVLASAPDAPLLESGGRGDYHFVGAGYRFPPVKVDRIVQDGEIVRLGGTALTAHLTPGHTKGTTTWTLRAHDRLRRERNVVFMGSTAVNEGVKLIDNPKYPEIVTDYQRTFMILKALPCDVLLTAHASVFRGREKAAAAAAGKGEDAFVDLRGCQEAVARSQTAFAEELSRQRDAARKAGGR
jgi:metallo-beta-lactamase class B